MTDGMEGMIIESRTQTPEQIAKVLKASGYDAVVTTTDDDGKEVTTTVPAEPETPAAEAGEETSTEGEETPKPEESEEEPAAVDATAAEEPTDDKDKGEHKDKKPRETGAQRLKRQRDDLARQLAEANAKLAERTSAPTGATDTAVKPEPVTEPADEKPKPKPKYEDFEDAEDQYAAHVEALTDWKIDERDRLKRVADREKQKSEEAVRTQSSAREVQELIKNQWEAQAAVERTVHQDFDAVIPTVQVTFPMQIALQAYDRGAGIAYYLGTHPEEAAELVKKTTLPDKYTPLDITRAQRVVTREYDRIEGLLTQAEDADGDGTQVETPAKPVATPETRKPPVKPTPVAAAPPSKPVGQTRTTPKPKPPTYAEGTPGAAGRRLKEMSPDELRSMDPREYAKRSEAGEWN